MRPSPADSSLAIPWFNNIWLDDVSPNRVTPDPAPSRLATSACRGTHNSAHSSSRHTVSTLSAVDHVSLCSLPSAPKCSAQDLLQVLSDASSFDRLSEVPIPHPPVAVRLAEPDAAHIWRMRLLRVTSADESALQTGRVVNTPVEANPSSPSASQRDDLADPKIISSTSG